MNNRIETDPIAHDQDRFVHPDETRTDEQIAYDEKYAVEPYGDDASDEYWADYYAQFPEKWMGDVSEEHKEIIIASAINTKEDLVQYFSEIRRDRNHNDSSVIREDAENSTEQLIEEHNHEDDPIKAAVVTLVHELQSRESNLINLVADKREITPKTKEEGKEKIKRNLKRRREQLVDHGENPLAAWMMAVEELYDEYEDMLHREEEDTRYAAEYDPYPYEDEDEDPLAGDVDRWVHPDETRE